MASAKEHSILYRLGAELGSGFNSTFSKAQAAIASTQKEIQTLSKTQSDISSFQKQQGAVEATKQKLVVLQQQYDNIQREISETEGYSSALENKLLAKQQQIERTTASLESHTRKMEELDSQLQEAGVDTSNLTGESARLAGQIDELKQKQEEAAASANEFGEAGESAFDGVKNALVAAGLVAGLHEIGEAYKEVISIAGDFEETMSSVKALSGATEEEMEALSALAKELGGSTKFTAKEAAEAMTYMGMAGWSAADMLDGMDGVLQLAAASGEDLAAVSDIVTDSLTAFGLKASDTAHYSDVLAAAATNANTNVAMMGNTFKYAAPLAGALGYSVEDVATMVGLMANAGIKGTQAGTALRTMFTKLTDGAVLSSAAFGDVTVATQNADGTMRELGDVVNDLRGYFAQMTQAEKIANAEALVGNRAMSGFISMMNATGDDFNKLKSSIDNCTGAAQRMAEIKLDNMNGQLTLMQSAWDGLKISIGEQFTPAMGKLYGVATDVITGITDFVKAHPGVVKAIASIAAGLAAATGVILGVQAAIKVASLATAAWTAVLNMNPIVLATTAVVGLTVAVATLTATYNEAEEEYKSLTATSREQYDTMQDLRAEYDEVCDALGETSAEAQLLKADLDDATAAYENNKQTAEQMAEAHRELIDAYNEEVKAYQDTISGIENESVGAMNLVGKLEELVNAEDKSVESKGKIYTMVRLLNDAVPELGLAYDELTGSLNMTGDAIRAVIQAQINREKNEANYEELKKQIAQEGALKAELDKQKIETERRRQEYEAAQAAAEAEHKRAAASSDPGRGNNSTAWVDRDREAKEAKEALDAQIAAEREAQDAYDTNQQMIGDLTNAVMGYSEANTEVERSINTTMTAMQALSEAYEKAYAAAYESVTGQYEIWDKADKVVATSVSSINSNLEGQTKYWNDYNTNLEKLRERTGDIEGLQEVIASFADGTPQSVNAIAGMAGATDEQLKKMVANYTALQEAQQITSESIADLKTNYSAEMDALAEELADDIEGMNFYEEAATAAESTLQGYIDAANASIPRVQAAYGRVRQAAVDAINNSVTTTGYMASHGGAGWHYEPSSGVYVPDKAYASGTKNAAPGWSKTGEDGMEAIITYDGGTVPTPKEVARMLSIYDEERRITSEVVASDGNSGITSVRLVGENGPELVYMQGGEVVLTASETRDMLREYNASSKMFKEVNGVEITSAYATGTNYAKQGVALVGENGPELVYMQGGETVITAKETEALLREYGEVERMMTTNTGGINYYAAGTKSAKEYAALLREYPREVEYMRGEQPQLTIAPDPYTNQSDARGAEYDPGRGSAIPSVDEPGGYGRGNIQLTIKVEVHVDGNANQDTIDALEGAADDLAERVTEKVMERLEDEERDRARRVYA